MAARPQPRYDEVKPAIHINVDVSSTSRKHFLDLSSLAVNLPRSAVTAALGGSIRYKRYSDVYRILSAIKKGTNPVIHFSDPLIKVTALQETLEILFYEDIISDVLLESGFYSRFLQLRDQGILLTIMAYDFQKHKFCQRPPHFADSLPENMRNISEALWAHRVKLSATLARMRVASNAHSIAQLLPPMKQSHFTMLATVPVYARMACSPASEEWTLAISELQSVGISFVQERSRLKNTFGSATFVTKDLLAFSSDCRSILYNGGLRDGPMAVIRPQDFTSYMCIEKLSSILQSLAELEHDVVLTNCDNGTIPAHLSSLMKGRGKIIVLGAAPVHIKAIESHLSAISVNNVQLIPVAFPNVDPSDEMFSNVGLVLCNVPCSLTSVLHPVDFIMQEGDQYFAQVFKTQSVSIPTLLREQKNHLYHALKFEQAKYLAYFTRSNLEAENRDLVDSVMEGHVTEAEGNPEIRQFEIESSTGPEDKGYLCILKQLPRMLPAPSDVIAQAILRGVLSADGIIEYSGHTKKKKKTTKKRIFSQHEGIPMTFAAQQKIVQKKSSSLERSRPFLM